MHLHWHPPPEHCLTSTRFDTASRSNAAPASVSSSGLFLGDGALRYRPEQVLEAYYLFTPTKGVAVTFDAQRIANPGYNADRGPATFFGVCLHVEN